MALRDRGQTGHALPLASPDILDTLRLSVADARRLMELLQSRHAAAPRERREATRVMFDRLEGVPLHVLHPGGGRQTFRVLPVDLSAGGAGILHGGYLHADAGVVLDLPDRDGTVHTMRGRVAWCGHVQGRVHAVGIAFDEPADMPCFTDVLACLPVVEEPSHQLGGAALVADTNPHRRDAMRHVLGVLHARMIAVAIAAEVLPLARDLAVDWVIVDQGLIDAGALIRQLQAADLPTPVVSVRDPHDPTSVAPVTEITRPVTPALLYDALVSRAAVSPCPRQEFHHA